MSNGRLDDRRVTRSKALLQRALMSLVAEKPFDRITVRDILDRADVGRTTFYAHFQSKEDLFLSSHERIIAMISDSFLSEEGALRAEPAPELIAFLEMMGTGDRDMFFNLTWGSAAGEILRLLKERIAEQLAARLQELFREEDSAVPFVVLARHVAGSVMSLSSWWVEKRMPYSAQDLGRMLHRMTLAVLRDALGK